MNILDSDSETSDEYYTNERTCLLPKSVVKSSKLGVRTKLKQLASQLSNVELTLQNSGRVQYQKLPDNKKQKAMTTPASSVGDAAAALSGNLQLPPLRTLDDFVLGSARFQLPNLKDFEKWGNRVVKNLMYYQTNYFLLFLAIYILMIALNPVKIVSGLLVQGLLIAIIWQFFSGKSKTNFIASRLSSGNPIMNQHNAQQKWYILAGALLISYLFLHWISAVLLTAFTLLLPISLTFVHASLRLRNMKNKITNTIENFGPSTPMGALLDAWNVRADGVLN